MPAKMNLISKFFRVSSVATAHTNRILLTLVVLIGVSMLTACGAGASNKTASLAPESVLAAGILKLEGTAQAVDTKEAAVLLPLWQLLSELKSSGSSAQEEIDAVVEQIEATLTAEQSSAIDEMGLSQADVAAVVEIQASTDSTSGSSTTSARSARFQGAAGVAGMIAGGPPADGGMLLDAGVGGAPAPTSSTSSQSSTAAKSQAAASSAALIQQVIKLLQGKIGSSG